MKKDKHFRLKIIIYFIAGFNFGYIGLIVAGLWIKFKTKINKQAKFIALIIGFGVFLLYHYILTPYILDPQAEKSLFSKYPETQTIKTAVKSKYTDGKVKVGITWNKSLTTQGQPTTSFLTVEYDSIRKLTQGEMQDISKLTCNALRSTGKNYDEVSIINVYSYLPINVGINGSLRMTATCNEWVPSATSGQRIITVDIGIEGVLSTLKIKVNSMMETQSTTAYGRKFVAPEGTKLIIINIDSTNITDASFAFPNDILLSDAKENLYQPLTYSDSIVDRTMRPGISETGILTYIVPIDTSDFSLQVIKKSTNDLYKFLVR